MSAAPGHSSSAAQQGFAAASPAQVRAALIPDEASRFDQDWREVMERATRSLDLTEVLRTLDAWRRVAWLTTSAGPERHRAMLASAQERARTGSPHPDAVPWAQLRDRLRSE